MAVRLDCFVGRLPLIDKRPAPSPSGERLQGVPGLSRNRHRAQSARVASGEDTAWSNVHSRASGLGISASLHVGIREHCHTLYVIPSWPHSVFTVKLIALEGMSAAGTCLPIDHFVPQHPGHCSNTTTHFLHSISSGIPTHLESATAMPPRPWTANSFGHAGIYAPIPTWTPFESLLLMW